MVTSLFQPIHFVTDPWWQALFPSDPAEIRGRRFNSIGQSEKGKEASTHTKESIVVNKKTEVTYTKTAKYESA